MSEESLDYPPCGHCARTLGGWAKVNGLLVCHTDQRDRPDCYRMITVYGHRIVACERCTEEPWEPLDDNEIMASVVSSLEQLQQMMSDFQARM